MTLGIRTERVVEPVAELHCRCTPALARAAVAERSRS
jgi:hypothetical protein